jgi:hypothetical protein
LWIWITAIVLNDSPVAIYNWQIVAQAKAVGMVKPNM